MVCRLRKRNRLAKLLRFWLPRNDDEMRKADVVVTKRHVSPVHSDESNSFGTSSAYGGAVY